MVSNGSMQNSSKIYNYNYTCIQKRVDQFFILSSRSMMSLIWDDQQTSLTGAASNEGQATGHAGFVLHSVLGGGLRELLKTHLYQQHTETEYVQSS